MGNPGRLIIIWPGIAEGLPGPTRFPSTFMEQLVIGWKITNINWNENSDKIVSYNAFVRLGEQRTNDNLGNYPDGYGPASK